MPNIQKRSVVIIVLTGSFVTVFFVLLVLYLFSWSYYVFIQDSLARKGVTTQGKVVDIVVRRGHGKYGRSRVSTYPIVSFTDTGNQVHMFQSKYDLPYRKGDHVSVMYLADIAIIKDEGKDIFNIPMLAVRLCALVFALYLFWCAAFYEEKPKRKNVSIPASSCLFVFFVGG